MGAVSRFAQRRVDARVVEIIARRDAIEHPNSSSDQAVSARRFLRRGVTSPS
jgi:hypothetical protein